MNSASMKGGFIGTKIYEKLLLGIIQNLFTKKLSSHSSHVWVYVCECSLTMQQILSLILSDFSFSNIIGITRYLLVGII